MNKLLEGSLKSAATAAHLMSSFNKRWNVTARVNNAGATFYGCYNTALMAIIKHLSQKLQLTDPFPDVRVPPPDYVCKERFGVESIDLLPSDEQGAGGPPAPAAATAAGPSGVGGAPAPAAAAAGPSGARGAPATGRAFGIHRPQQDQPRLHIVDPSDATTINAGQEVVVRWATQLY